ncbi:MAG TPA: TspO/MBR family protein [Rhodocyclaceae bacterium]|nr:TspO/MBR family protein [Rhodocyclaceae bacterium]
MRRKETLGLVAWLAISFVAAAIGSIASIHAGEFYAQLLKPSWAPPAWLFGPVWTVLYALMGIAAWLVWRANRSHSCTVPLILFLIQLVVNALWSWLFFKWHLGAYSFADILLLWVLIVTILPAFWHTRPLAGALLLPYLLWVSFAVALNYSVWQLNPMLLGG